MPGDHHISKQNLGGRQLSRENLAALILPGRVRLIREFERKEFRHVWAGKIWRLRTKSWSMKILSMSPMSLMRYKRKIYYYKLQSENRLVTKLFVNRKKNQNWVIFMVMYHLLLTFFFVGCSFLSLCMVIIL